MRSVIVVIFTFFLSLASHAQDTASTQSLFWEVSGNGLASPSYLYGTMHFLCKRDVVFSDTVRNKMAACKMFYKETNIESDTAAVLEKYRRKDMTLRKLIGKNEFKRVQHFFAGNPRMTDSVLNTLDTYTLMLAMLEAKGKCKTTSVDRELFLIAQKDGLAIHELESIEEHMKAGDRQNLSQQAAYISYLLNNIDWVAQHLRDEISLYQAGNLSKMYELAAFNSDGSKSYAAINLGEQRNKTWIPRMEKAIRENSCFFAFGCAHLPGQNGIINLLRKLGYTVTPIYDY